MGGQGDMFGPRRVPKDGMRQLVEDSREPCHCCGVPTPLSPHSIDRSKLFVLRVMAEMMLSNKWVRVEEGSRMVGTDNGDARTTAYRARAHASRLVWFGLVDHRGVRISSYRVNRNGFLFLRGDAAVPQKILCRGGVVVYESTEERYAREVTATFDKNYWDNYPWSDFI